MLHLHRAERADAWSTGSPMCCASRRPIRSRRRSSRCRPERRTVGHPAAVARARHAPGEQDGVCANVRFPHPSALVADALAARPGSSPTRIRGSDRRSAAARDHRRVRAAGVVRDARAAPRASATPRSASGRTSARHRPPPGRAVRLLRRASSVDASVCGRTATTPRRCPTTCAGRPSCGGSCAAGSARRARPSASPRLPAAAHRADLVDLPAGCRCSGPPG